METFWTNETLGTELLENNVLQKFNEVDFTGNRYQVKLPYKENHEILGDNFMLKILTHKFEYDKNLLAEYDNVFKEQNVDNLIEKAQFRRYNIIAI